MITSFALSNLRASGLLLYANTYLKIYKEAQLTDDISKAIEAKFEKTVLLLQDALNMAGSELLTEQIAQADEDQDFAFLILRHSVEIEKFKRNNRYHPEADLIMEAIRKSGYSLHTFSYTKQAQAMTHLLESFENDQELKTALTSLGMDELVAQLRTKFEKFMELRESKREERLNKAESKRLPAIRRECKLMLTIATDHINTAIVLESEDEKFEVLASKIEEFNKSYTTQIKARETRKAKGETEDLEIEAVAVDESNSENNQE